MNSNLSACLFMALVSACYDYMFHNNRR